MRIRKYTFTHSNDFNAEMACEHCGHVQQLTGGYHDGHYHNRVIPAMTCDGCGKNRAGDVTGRGNNEHVPR